jgi:hypothetical protein
MGKANDPAPEAAPVALDVVRFLFIAQFGVRSRRAGVADNGAVIRTGLQRT